MKFLNKYLLWILLCKFSFAQQISNNISIIGDTVLIKYPIGKNGYVSFDDFPKTKSLFVFRSGGTVASDTIFIDKNPNTIIFKTLNYFDDNLVSQVCIYKFHKKHLLRIFFDYYDTVPQTIKTIAFSCDYEPVGSGMEFYQNGNIRTTKIHSRDSFGRNRTRKNYIAFIEDDFLNGITLGQKSSFEASAEMEKLTKEYYPNNKIKKEVEYEKKSKAVYLIRYRNDGTILSKASLKYGNLTQEQLKNYYNQQETESNSFLFNMTFKNLKTLWYYDGVFIEYGTNGYENRKYYKNGILCTEPPVGNEGVDK